MTSRHPRRSFTKLALAALPAARLFSLAGPLGAAGNPNSKPNSKVNGVQIGLNVPYSFKDPAMSGDAILANCVALGVSAVELRTQPVEAALGAPAPTAADELRKWRLGVSLDRARQFRKKYEDAGVAIEIVKVDGIFRMTDDVVDYAFNLAKALGARAISTEIARADREDDAAQTAKVTADHKRIGAFADKHKLMVGYHGHTHTGAKHFEEAFALARYNGANLDIGHFVAGGNGSPVAFIKQHHARITHIHVKDRKWDPATKAGPNMPFGEGDTPIKEALRLIRDNKWNIQATIEFEYKVPPDSDRMKELARAVKYCRDALA